VQNTCGYTGKTGVTGCCDTPADCPAQSNPCVTNTCTANQCGTMVIAGCNPDLAVPPDLLPPPDLFGADLTGPPQDLSVPDGAPADASAGRDLSESDATAVTYSLTGGGGCTAASSAPNAPWALVALFFFALRRRRRT
jgi:MYXO-CTERM domain-containing protein